MIQVNPTIHAMAFMLLPTTYFGSFGNYNKQYSLDTRRKIFNLSFQHTNNPIWLYSPSQNLNKDTASTFYLPIHVVIGSKFSSTASGTKINRKIFNHHTPNQGSHTQNHTLLKFKMMRLSLRMMSHVFWPF